MSAMDGLRTVVGIGQRTLAVDLTTLLVPRLLEPLVIGAARVMTGDLTLDIDRVGVSVPRVLGYFSAAELVVVRLIV